MTWATYAGQASTNRVALLNAGKERAADRRNRGLPSGKAAKGHLWQLPKLDEALWSSHVEMAHANFARDCRQAVNDFRAACLNGPGWEAEQWEILL